MIIWQILQLDIIPCFILFKFHVSQTNFTVKSFYRDKVYQSHLRLKGEIKENL